MKYRASRAKEWTEISLDRAMDMVVDRVWESRKRTFVQKKDGATINTQLNMPSRRRDARQRRKLSN